MQARVQEKCAIPETELFFYSIYGSKFNKETLHNLKYEFTFEEVMNHLEYVTIQEDLEAEHYARMEKSRK